MYKKTHHIHFVGIGGIGMSGIAEVLINIGYRVSGSDAKCSEITRRLSTLGGLIYDGHAPENVGEADVVVVSSAIGTDNPEVRHAQRTGIPVIPRAEMLGELMRLKYGIAVAGAHGKTTTTSLIAQVVTAGAYDPTVVIGGRLNTAGTNAVLGSGEFLIAEADESDGSFVHLPPTIAVVTNIDREHLDHYQNMDNLRAAFRIFLSKVPFYGLAVTCNDDPALREITTDLSKRLFTYGIEPGADLQARAIAPQKNGSAFEVWLQGELLGTVELMLVGRHNVLNALAAIAVGLELDIPFATISRALHEFQGIQRRFQTRGREQGITWIDDYGHHPTEIRATLAAARQLAARRTVVLFQPHRYSRTRDLFQEFMTAFADADTVLITNIYPAGELPIAGVTAAGLCTGLREQGHPAVLLAPTLPEAATTLEGILQPDDLLITLGAGDVWRGGQQVMEALHRGHREKETHDPC